MSRVFFDFSAVDIMDINNKDGTPPPPPPPHPPPPGNNDDPIDIDDDMEDEETQRMMEQEMEYLTELQLLYDLSSPTARKEYHESNHGFMICHQEKKRNI